MKDNLIFQDEADLTPASQNESQEEGWGDYLLRNMAKTPSLIYQTYRSGFGLGNIARLAGKTAEKRGLPGASYIRKAQELALPSVEQAGKELKGYLRDNPDYEELASRMGVAVDDPKFLQLLASGELNLGGLGADPATAAYLTESQQGDWPAELALTLGATGASKALTTLPGLARTGGSLVGGSGGGMIGKVLGGLVGEPELGQAVGGLIGSIGGSYGVNKLQHSPLKMYGKKIFQKERQGLMNEYQEIAKRPKLVENEIKSYDKQIEDLRGQVHDLDKKSQLLASKEAQEANKLAQIAKRVKRDATKGLDQKDQDAVNKASNDILKLIGAGKKAPSLLVNAEGNPLKGKAPEPFLNMKDATAVRKNIHGQIYHPKASDNLKRALYPLSEALDNFNIEKGSKEYNQIWNQYKDISRKMFKMEGDRQDWLKGKNTELREAKSETRKAKTKLDNELKQMGKSPEAYLQKQAQKQAPPSLLDEFNRSTGGSLGVLSGTIAGGAPGAVLTAAGGGALKNFINRGKVNKYVAEFHPEIYEEGRSQIAKHGRKGLPSATRIGTAR